MLFAVEEYDVEIEEWFTKLLGIEHGIPSYDTFGDVNTVITPSIYRLFFLLGLRFS